MGSFPCASVDRGGCSPDQWSRSSCTVAGVIVRVAAVGPVLGTVLAGTVVVRRGGAVSTVVAVIVSIGTSCPSGSTWCGSPGASSGVWSYGGSSSLSLGSSCVGVLCIAWLVDSVATGGAGECPAWSAGKGSSYAPGE